MRNNNRRPNSFVRFFVSFRYADSWILLAASLLLGAFLLFDRGQTDRVSTPMRFAVVLILCGVFYLGGRLRRVRLDDPSVMRVIFFLFFLLYLYLLIRVTLLDPALGRGGTVYGTTEEEREFYLENYVNLIPFATVWKVYLKGCFLGKISPYLTALNLLGNLGLLVPLALFFPIFFRRLRNFWRFFFAVLAVGAAVELLQLRLMIGSCDVDDLILNVSGALLAFLFERSNAGVRVVNRLLCRDNHDTPHIHRKDRI